MKKKSFTKGLMVSSITVHIFAVLTLVGAVKIPSKMVAFLFFFGVLLAFLSFAFSCYFRVVKNSRQAVIKHKDMVISLVSVFLCLAACILVLLFGQ